MKNKETIKRIFSGIISMAMLLTLSVSTGKTNMSKAAETYTVVFPVKNGMKIAYYQGNTKEYGGYHRGIDIHDKDDDTIYSAVESTVTSVVNTCPHVSKYSSSTGSCPCGTGNASYGNYVFAKDSNGILYIYAHMKQNSIKVKKGDKLSAGQAIGTMGSSGAATGKHLHFEMNKGSTVINNNPTKETGTYSYYGNVTYLSGISGMIVSGKTEPTGQLKEGHYFELKGVVSSEKKITKIWGGVYVRGGSATSEYCEATPNSTSYDLHGKFNDEIIFDNLKVGYYTYRIEATDSDGKTYKLIESDFQIGSPSYTSKSVKVTFYRNFDSEDKYTVNETFTNGVSNQKFGYTPEGVGRYGTMNDADKGFGKWVRDGYKLLGWSEERNSTEGNYNTYSNVKDSWIESKSPSVNLYAVWALIEETPAENNDTVYGDFDMNGTVDLTDLSYLSIALADKKEITGQAKLNADTDGDGMVNLADLATMRQYLSKIIDTLGPKQ